MSGNNAEVLSIFEKQNYEFDFVQHSSFARGENEFATRMITYGAILGASLIMMGVFTLAFTLFPALSSIEDFWFQALGCIFFFGGVTGIVCLAYKFIFKKMEDNASEVRYQDGKNLQKMALEHGFKMPHVEDYNALVRTKFEQVETGMMFRPVFVGWGGKIVTLHLQTW